MKKRGKARALVVVLAMLLVIAIVHTIFHFLIYGTGIPGINKSGISGLSIGNLNIGDDLKNNVTVSNTSKISVSIEWMAVVLLGMFTVMYSRMNPENDLRHINIKERNKGLTTTDIDILYDILKEKKKISLSSIQRVFKVHQEVALEWCKILESGNLATINYPGVGEPSLILIK